MDRWAAAAAAAGELEHGFGSIAGAGLGRSWRTASAGSVRNRLKLLARTADAVGYVGSRKKDRCTVVRMVPMEPELEPVAEVHRSCSTGKGMTWLVSGVDLGEKKGSGVDRKTGGVKSWGREAERTKRMGGLMKEDSSRPCKAHQRCINAGTRRAEHQDGRRMLRSCWCGYTHDWYSCKRTSCR